MSAPRFAETWCSQCGADLGPGDSGVSDCRDHRASASQCPACLDAPGSNADAGCRTCERHASGGAILALAKYAATIDCELTIDDETVAVTRIADPSRCEQQRAHAGDIAACCAVILDELTEWHYEETIARSYRVSA